MDAFPSMDSSSTVFNSKNEEEDDWVVVKKQKINILIPPPSPSSQHTGTELGTKPTMQPRVAKRRSIVKEIKHGRQPKGRHQKKTLVLTKNKSDQGSEGILRTQPGNRPDVDASENLVPEPKPQRSQVSFDTYGAGNVGALEVVNRRIRARNLRWKLQQVGGLTAWLASQGLDRFAAVFERRKRSEYELVDLTMRKLKDLGMNAVGARRKLIHAIDLLCQPYFSKAGNDV